MIYIKLGEDKDLAITVNDTIYRGENLSKKITFLLPATIDEVDIQTATIYLCYIRADSSADIVILDRKEEMYNTEYYQFALPVNCKMSKYPGEICMWMTIYSGEASNPVIAKSGECVVRVHDSKNMDDCMCDHQLTALYQMQKSIDKVADSIESELASTVDGLSYDQETHELTLTSGGELIGNSVVVPDEEYLEEAEDAVEDEWVDMGTESDDGEYWEDM